MTTKRRSVLKGGVASLSALAAPALARAQAAPANTLIFADDSNSDVTYDPRVTQSRHEEQVIVQVFDQLIMSDENGKLAPGLATSWHLAPDAMSIHLKLRDGVKFHDGTGFNAEAVKFTLDTIADPKTGSQGAVDMLGPYDRTEIIGPHEVRIHFKSPNAGIIDTFTENELSIVSPSAVARLGNTGFAQAPVGTGPFKFVSWERGREVLLERNPDYNWAPDWSTVKGPSGIERIIHRFMQDDLREQERGIFLAGDDVSWTPAWVEGAVQTSLNAVWGVTHHFGGATHPDNPGPGDLFADLGPIVLPD